MLYLLYQLSSKDVQIMNKCLILLTDITPLEKSESFVKNELSFHCKNFSKIIVLALQNTKNDKLPDSYANNVSIYQVSNLAEKQQKLKSLVCGALSVINPKDRLKSELKHCKLNFKKAVMTGYFEHRCKEKFGRCIKILDNFDFTEFDEIVVYSYWFFLTCRVGVEVNNYLKNKGLKTSFISRAHRYDLYENVNPLKFLPEREFLIQNLDYLFPCSFHGETYLKKSLSNFSNKIICNRLGSNNFGLNKYSSTFHIVSCSRTVEVKRLDKLINGLEALKDKGIEIYWTHIGDGKLQKEIENIANQKLSFMNCEFLGRMDNNEIMEYYSTHPVNLFVNVSNSEGLPVSIMEATSFGIPVLATDVGGTSEIVIDNYNGKLLKSDFSSTDFAMALLEIYNLNETDYNNLRHNARKHWEENFSAEKNYPKFSNIIANIERANL